MHDRNELTVRAMLFDLDGVLVDSTEGVELAWRDWASGHGLDAEAVIAVVHGRRAADTVAEVAPSLNVRDEVAALSHREATDARGIHPIPGAAALVSSLPPARWAVVTSGTRAVATFRLEVGSVPMPAVLIAAEDVSRGKPDPEGYLRAARLLGVDPSECVVIEDAPAGLSAAKAAGMHSVGVATTFDASALVDATIVVRAIADLAVHFDETTQTLRLTAPVAANA